MYEDDSETKKLLPEIGQVRNRKAGWKKDQVKGKWKQLSSHDELFEWAASRLCSSKEEFDAVEERELVVLDVFQSNEAQETKETTYGMDLSCKRLLQNFKTADDDGDPVSLSCDGTYRLTDAGWTLINIGVVGVVYDAKERQHHQRFYPGVFGFVRTHIELFSLEDAFKG
ncbi:hypothetical protein PHYSODRAFT_309671 [Phytophthora sojae]|uniref:Uncharacterized protein n=1 Tax=Phytophthora sojae (strain P6497) TaxID=1094619 RepID=G4YJ24_PHYSP|nr:hypothetical protein PHYSODRAFT_309671 [Phytophthora sojae]EGZ29164.1 hypothetical protein PHYSODRAFT_309671 [Phytophthora sojae]|eukprot:XP_009516439.1 hypothetical protein PHYSODRAFT_309671 [Phytophthora sojae]